jgi:hypothetical protein
MFPYFNVHFLFNFVLFCISMLQIYVNLNFPCSFLLYSLFSLLLSVKFSLFCLLHPHPITRVPDPDPSNPELFGTPGFFFLSDPNPAPDPDAPLYSELVLIIFNIKSFFLFQIASFLRFKHIQLQYIAPTRCFKHVKFVKTADLQTC